MRENIAALKVKLAGVLPFLDEKQRRVLAAAESETLGRGGVQKIAEITGLSRHTIYRGLEDLKQGDPNSERVRDHGGGRKRLTDKHPNLRNTLESLIEPTTRGDPESPLKWTCKSVRKLQAELSKSGFSLSNQSVANILHELEYSLQANRKTSEGKSHPDRDLQFRNINKTVSI